MTKTKMTIRVVASVLGLFSITPAFAYMGRTAATADHSHWTRVHSENGMGAMAHAPRGLPSTTMDYLPNQKPAWIGPDLGIGSQS